MTNLLVIREQLMGFFSRFEAYIVAVLKFITALIVLLIINADLGFMSKLDNGAIVLIISLLCSFLPMNLIVIINANKLHVSAVCLELRTEHFQCFFYSFKQFWIFNHVYHLCTYKIIKKAA